MDNRSVRSGCLVLPNEAKAMRFAAIIIACLVLLAGCGDGDGLGPPEVHLGEDICALCGMIVSDARFATALYAKNQYGSYEQKVFDDLGDMVAWEAANQGVEIGARYVRDYLTLEWIHAETAVVVHSDDLKTPMAFGLAACGTQAAAEDLVKRYPGEILTYTTLISRAMD